MKLLSQPDVKDAMLDLHISHSKLCKNHYTKEELSLLKDWAKESIAEIRQIYYDPEKRKNRYLEEKKKKQLKTKNKVIYIKVD